MSARQLLLLKAPQPLVERFGEEFFRQIPQRPGVYLMCGAREGILYVGKAKNLRQRLNSYRAAYPDRLTVKLRRVLPRVERILWDECASEKEALLRETQLLRNLRPRCNTANVRPPARLFLGWAVIPGGLAIGLSTAETVYTRTYGAFNGYSQVAYSSLLRLLGWALPGGESGLAWSADLLTGRSPGRCLLVNEAMEEAKPCLLPLLDRYFLGLSPCLIEWLRGQSTTGISIFEQRLRETDLAQLEEFYLMGPQRNRAQRELSGAGQGNGGGPA